MSHDHFGNPATNLYFAAEHAIRERKRQKPWNELHWLMCENCAAWMTKEEAEQPSFFGYCRECENDLLSIQG